MKSLHWIVLLLACLVSAGPVDVCKKGEISDTLRIGLVAGGGSVSTNLTCHFAVADIPKLTLSDAVPGVVSASLANGTLTLTPDSVEFTAPLRDTLTVSAPDTSVAVIVDVTSCVTTARASSPQVELVAGGTLERSIAGYFHNSKSEALTYTAESSNVDTFTVSLSGDQMTLTGGALAGEAELNLTAKNSCGAAVDTVAVVVEEPTGPVVDVLLPDITLAKKDTVYIYLPDHFSSPDGNDITYETDLEDHGLDEDYVGVELVGMQQDSLQIVGQHVHPASETDGSELRVEAGDDDGSVSDTMDIRVTPTAPRIIKAIPDTTLASGGASADYTLSEYFEDPDGAFDDLVFEVASVNAAVTTSIADGVLTVTSGTVTTETTETITVKAVDNDEQSVSTSFDVTVAIVLTCEDITVTLTVNDDDAEFDMDDYCSDPEDDELTYELGPVMGSAASVTLDDNDLTISPSEAGTTTATVTADDDNGNTATSSISVTVVEVLYCDLIEVTLTVNDAAKVFDMDSYCSDPDNDELTYELGPVTGSAASVTLDDENLTISPSEVGTTTATVTAEDDNGNTATSEITATVNNLAPGTVGTIEDIVVHPDDDDKEISVVDYFSDPENEALVYTARSSSPDVVTVSMGTGDDAGTLTLSDYSVGSSTVSVTARDPHQAAAVQTFQFSAVCSVPTSRTIPVQLVLLDADADIALDDYFSDPRDDELSYTATRTGVLLTLDISDDNTLTIEPEIVGSATVAITAVNACGGTSAARSFGVTVRGKPVASGSIPNQSLVVSGTAKTLDVSDYFTEPDGDTVTYSARVVTGPQRIPDYVSVSMSGSTLTMTPGTTPGRINVEVTATDRDGSATQTFTVYVTRSN